MQCGNLFRRGVKLLVIAFVMIVFVTDSREAEAQSPQDSTTALRKRVSEFYALLKVKRLADAEKFVTSDTVDQFRLMANGEFLSAEINSIEMARDQKSAVVLIDLAVSNANIPVPFNLPRKTNWRLENDDWKIVIPSQTIESSGPCVMFPSGCAKPGAAAKLDLEFAEPIADLTPIKQGEKKLAKYSFKNTSDHPIAIKGIESDCKCISLKSELQPVKPGETGEIVVEFDSTDYAYEYRQTVTVVSNPGEQRVNLLLSASITPKP